MPAELATSLLGKRKRNFDIIKYEHLRDYTFNEVKGGLKGEKADYLLIEECG